MGLETGTTIANLDSTFPTAGDPRSEGDDHLRLIKSVLKSQFPGVGGNGFAVPITAKETELNFLSGLTSNAQAQFDKTLFVDSSAYAGADRVVNQGQTFSWDVSAATSLNLRVAAGTNQHYVLTLDSVAATSLAAVIGTVPNLLLGGSARAGGYVLFQNYLKLEGSVTTTGSRSTQDRPFLAVGYTIRHVIANICTDSDALSVYSKFWSASDTADYEGVFHTKVLPAGVGSITSLGTITFGNAFTGKVKLLRLW
jgi:hypothetical protein